MMRRRLRSRRAVSVVIGSFLVIMMTITAGVLFYAYANRMLGTLLNVNPPETMDNLRIEAYNWLTLGAPVLNVRNVGTNALTMTSAHWFVGGFAQSCSGAGCGCTGTLNPGALCVETLSGVSVSGVTPSSGITYVVKIVLADGATFAAPAIAGQVTGQTGVT